MAVWAMVARRQPGFSFLAAWTVVHAVLIATALVVPCGFFILLIAGTIGQWRLVQPWLYGAADWLVATGAGIIIGAIFLSFAFFDPANRSDGVNALLFALFPVTIGGAQLVVLRGRGYAAAWWPIANEVGGALFWLTYDFVWQTVDRLYSRSPERWIVTREVAYHPPSLASVTTWIAQGLAGGIAYGILTGLLLLWLLRDQRTPRPVLTEARAPSD